jgi:arabinan endo-1,5-alpha-L-arabinosidase
MKEKVNYNFMRRYSSMFLIVGIFALIFACKDEPIVPDDGKDGKDTIPVIDTIPNIDTVTVNYNPPTYIDNYVSIASWGSRTQWNLANVHDPTVEKCGEYYYMYQTDASYGNAHEGHGHYPYRRSKDLVNWEFLGMAFTTVPAWVKDSLNNMRARMTPALPAISNPSYGFWAPCIRKAGNKYRLYYCVVVTNCITGTDANKSWTERAFIGLAESDDLSTNKWEDKGMVVCSEPDGKQDYLRSSGNDWNAYFQFNAIDPSFIITPEGDQWLIYGSWHSGIAAVKLNPETGKPYSWNKLSDYGVRIAGRGSVNSNRWQALEAPEIIYNEATGYYYLFLAYDELSVAYNTRVARSKTITGPYLGIDGRNVTIGADCWPMITHPYAFNNNPGWVGISHCCVFQDPDTKQWYYSSQGRLPEGAYGNAYSNAIMMGHVREIFWNEEGWPVVSPERYAAVPKTKITESLLVGNWEQITLQYNYKTIQKSVSIGLKSDHTLSGISGTWSFDEAKQTLTINNNKILVNNGLDWESTPRKRTIVYSGLLFNGVSVWGKKVK